MSILNYLPEFKVVEVNRLTGLFSGHILSQQLLDPTSVIINTTNVINVVENGFIVGLAADLQLDAYDATTMAQPFLVFTEEILTFMDSLKYYATEADADGDIYPRAIGLYVGDVFTTNNYNLQLPESAPLAGNAATLTEATANFAAVINGQLHLQATRDQNGFDSLFAIEESTLPDGTIAVRATYLG